MIRGLLDTATINVDRRGTTSPTTAIRLAVTAVAAFAAVGAGTAIGGELLGRPRAAFLA